MDMKQVPNSSNILEAGHDPLTNKMRVKFRNQKLFEYDNVSAEQHANMMKADSVGSHFSKHIRHNHECTCLDKKEDK